MEVSPQRRCPRCGTPVAQRAETCLMCGALLKEQKKSQTRLPTSDMMLPLLFVIALAAVWMWKPWQLADSQNEEIAAASSTPDPSPVPTATSTAAPTATPLNSPTPSPTPTLPPNQTMHVVEAGETIITIAKRYGTTASAVLQANNKKPTSIIKPGDQLVIPLPVADTPTPTPTVLPSPTPLTYVVKKGDTLSAIAAQFKTTAAALMAANGITDPSNLHIGARILIVPPGAVPTATPVTPNIYTVKSGDVLIDIASKFGVTVAQLKAANNLKSDLLRVGQKLIIPGGTPAATPTAVPEAPPSPTPSPSPTPKEAVAVTESITETAPALTLLAAPTFTPAPPQAGVELLGPPEGAKFEGPDPFILLHWASVGILGEDEWYVVRLRRVDGEPMEPIFIWTKATSWRVPSELYVEGLTAPSRWRWRVLIMRQTGVADDGTWLGEEIRTPSPIRAFFWQ